MSTNTLEFIFFLLSLELTASISTEHGFVFNGFRGANLSIDGVASITSGGLLELTNTTQNVKGHAFHLKPLHFKSPAHKILSFSTTFVFGIIPEIPGLGSHGVVFVISPTTDFSTALASSYLGLFNDTNTGNQTNHIFAVELDTILNPEFNDIDSNHVGIDINGLNSSKSHTAGYYDDNSGQFNNLALISGQPMQVWIDFHAEEMLLDVTLSPVGISKPTRPLLSSKIDDLPEVMLDPMYVGFSSASGGYQTSHYLLGWSFNINSTAAPLDYAKLPVLPRIKAKHSLHLSVWLAVVSCSIVLLASAVVGLLVRKKMRHAELLEDWEQQYGPHRFAYRDLFRATKGFKERELLGRGGFGCVYRGVLPVSKIEVAVKKVSHGSRQGMQEFVAEIVSLGQMRHRNLVQLLGYCRRKEELLLVYDFMPNGSLDHFLYDHTKTALSWSNRFKIIKGVALGLLYLHEDWEQVVIHRDIKASNVLLDGELNGRLGDFGLARLYDHGTEPLNTHVVGTMGYLAPELARIGKATTATDVFAYGVFLLEVVCGRQPTQPHVEGEEPILMDLVLESWEKASLIENVDPRLGDDYNLKEVEMVLKLGVFCSHPMPNVRPSMRQVMQILEGNIELPELSPSSISFNATHVDSGG